MKTLIFTSLIFVSTLAQATCLVQSIRCEADNKFQNIYELDKLSCAAPGGPLRVTKNFRILNPLVSDCGPVARPNCMKPIFRKQLNTTRHNYFQADLKMTGKDVFLKIDDRGVVPQGGFQISTPGGDYILLDGYNCKRKDH